MKTISKGSVPVIFCLLFMLGRMSAHSQEEPRAGVRIEGSSFTMLRDTVVITYRFVAPSDESYNIDVLLRKGDDTTFSIIPKSMVGAVGEVRGGGEKVVLWDYKRDIPGTFRYSDDYWFEIRAVRIEREFSLEWWHYAVAGAGIAATVAIITTAGSDSPGGASGGLPGPPIIRPEE
jgi:hypothetical protein